MNRIHLGLTAWQVARSLVRDIYELTATFPKAERFGLVSQMRRACVSIPVNIAEGAARVSLREFRRFLAISRGSLAELETEIILANDLGYLQPSDELNSRIARMYALLGGLIRRQSNQISEETSK